MLDELRQQIQTRLDELLGEAADRLRHAIATLGSRDDAAPPPDSASSVSPERARRALAPRTATRKPARSCASAGTAATVASAEPVEPPAGAPAGGRARTAARAGSGSTKNAPLGALACGGAMTAGEVATATGLGRASVSTRLSKLANSGEVTKALVATSSPTVRQQPRRRLASAPAARTGNWASSGAAGCWTTGSGRPASDVRWPARRPFALDQHGSYGEFV